MSAEDESVEPWLWLSSADPSGELHAAGTLPSVQVPDVEPGRDEAGAEAGLTHVTIARR